MNLPQRCFGPANAFSCRRRLLLTAAIISAGIAGAASAQEHVVTPEMLEPAAIYSPFVDRDYPDRVLFGDTHFHTNLSFDAGLVGTSLDVDAGYRFARGETVRSNTGQPVQLIRPLDFLVITITLS